MELVWYVVVLCSFFFITEISCLRHSLKCKQMGCIICVRYFAYISFTFKQIAPITFKLQLQPDQENEGTLFLDTPPTRLAVQAIVLQWARPRPHYVQTLKFDPLPFDRLVVESHNLTTLCAPAHPDLSSRF